ncbi:Serine-threonine/tyrosine-protein kinase [Trypanosoma melophagium]|uniref:Serine-threonine/tyrosine-protein kinase n=1 Tax=Trypanosoma melophagium TaxID=715481 RepID=UPI00351A63E1|nr:Serine-threonine/tyrosine-protein kinase [Trypanosoma melophagium]
MEDKYAVIGPLAAPPRDGGRHVLLARVTDGLRCAAKTISCGRHSPQRLAVRRLVEVMRRVGDIAGLVDVVETETAITFVTAHAPLGSLREEIRRRRGILRRQKEKQQRLQEGQQQQLVQKQLSRHRAVCERGVEANAGENVEVEVEVETTFFSEEEVGRLMMQLLNILQELYTQGVMHDRVTSDHILLCDESFNNVRLCGFGNASLSCDGKESEGKQKEKEQQRSLSKRMYSSENLSISSVPLSVSSSSSYRLWSDYNNREAEHDVWLIGAIAYEMCTLGSRLSLQTTINSDSFITGLYSPGFQNMILSMLARDASSRPTRVQLECMLNQHCSSGFRDSRGSSPIPISRFFSKQREDSCLLTGFQPINESTQNEMSVRSVRTDPRDIYDTPCAVFNAMGGLQVPPRYGCNKEDFTKKQQRVPLSSSEVDTSKNGAIGVEPIHHIICVEGDGEGVKVSNCDATNSCFNKGDTTGKLNFEKNYSPASQNEECGSKNSSTVSVVMGGPYLRQEHVSPVKSKNTQSNDGLICCFPDSAEGLLPNTCMYPTCNTEMKCSHFENDTQLPMGNGKKWDIQAKATLNGSLISISKRRSIDRISVPGEPREDGANNVITTTKTRRIPSLKNSLSRRSSSVGSTEEMDESTTAPPTVEEEIRKSMELRRHFLLNFSCDVECESLKEEEIDDLYKSSKISGDLSVPPSSEAPTVAPVFDSTIFSDVVIEQSMTTEITVVRENSLTTSSSFSSNSSTVEFAEPLTNTEFCDGATEYSNCSSFVVVHEASRTGGKPIYRRHLRP